MYTLVSSKIDLRHRACEEGEDRLLNGVCGADKGKDGSVVRDIGRMVEQPDAVRRLNNLCHSSDDVQATSFADVRHALDKLIHGRDCTEIDSLL